VVVTGYVSYCLTKRRMLGRRLYLTILILPMYVSAGMIPTYLVYRLFGLTNTFWVYIVPNLVWAYFVLIMRTFFEALPPALEESAVVDGASEPVVFFRIIFPLSMPVIATVALFNAVWHWNTWFDTILLTRSKDLETLMSLLAKMLLEQQTNLISDLRNQRRVRYMTPTVLRAAMTIITTVPIVLVYPFLQRYFVKGVLIGAVKG
jgi:putative aldouronate transport system permease protein